MRVHTPKAPIDPDEIHAIKEFVSRPGSTLYNDGYYPLAWWNRVNTHIIIQPFLSKHIDFHIKHIAKQAGIVVKPVN